MHSFVCRCRRLVALLVGLGLVGQPLLAGASDFKYQVPIGATSQAIAPGQLAFAPTAYDFGTLVLGSSASTTVTLKNTGQDAVYMTGIQVTVPYSQTNNCPSTLVGGASCVVTVNYLPDSAGSFASTLSATSDSGANASLNLTGVAVIPTTTLSLSANSTDFAGVNVGTSSAVRTITLTNTGNSPANIQGIGITSGVADFSQSNDCTSLIPGASCSLNLLFTPGAYGPRAGNLTLVEERSSAMYSVALTGFGNSAVMALSPPNLTFGPAIENYSTSTAQLTVANAGNLDMTGLSVDTGGSSEFAVTDQTCATTLAGSASCTVTVTFAPTAAGARTGTLNVYSTNAGSATIGLNGNGTAQAPAAQASPASLSFADTPVDGTSAVQQVTFSNTGNVRVALGGVSLTSGTPQYTSSTTCGSMLEVGASCTATVTFTPHAAGTHAGVLRAAFASGDVDVSLTGAGTLGQASVSPATLTFADQQVASTSTAQTITVTNSGNRKLTVSGVSVTAGASDFGQSNTCSVIDSNGTCTISVTFTPTVAGARTGTVTMAHDGVDGVTTVDLSGAGRTQSASLSTPTFAATALGSSKTATATLSNTGIGALSVTVPSANSVTGTGFSFVATTCGTSLAIGATCTVDIKFAPTSTGAASGTLTVATGAGSQSVLFSSSGIQGQASLSSPSLTFAAQRTNTTSTAQTVTLTNTGSDVLVVSSVSISAGATDYLQTNNCSNVAVGGTCTVNVSFKPTADGTRSGMLSFTHNGSGPTGVSLSGTGQTPNASLSAPSFPATPVGANSTATATLNSTGTETLAVTVPSAASVTGASFSFVSTTCASTQAPGSNCTVTVRFSPTSTTAAAGSLTIGTSAGNQTVSLGSTGIQGYASISPSSVTFSPRLTGTTSATQTVTVTNTGTNTLTFTGVGISVGASDFAQSNGCGSVAVNGTCTVNVSFTPAADGSRSGTLSFTHNGGGIANVSLSGTGVPAPSVTSASFSPTSVTAGNSSTFSWSTTNATSASVSCSGAIGSGSGTSGSITVTTTGPGAGAGSCTVTATNSVGTTATGSASLAINAAYSYAWTTSDWSTPAACGSTTSTRTVSCLRSPDSTVVADSYCSGSGTKPASSQAVTDYSGCSYSWQTSGWSVPSGCGSVTQTRSVWCQRSDGTTVSDASCGGGKPSSSGSTTDYSACSYSWNSSSTGSCSTSCGTGTQTTTYSTCKRSDGTTVANSYCGSSTSSSSCSNYSGCSYSWTSSSTGSCSTSCGTGTQTTTYSGCKRSDGTSVAASYCGSSTSSSSCSNYAGCTYSANIGSWGACSTSCGTGTQTRSVSCTRSDGSTVANSYCGSPATSQSCSSSSGCAPVCPTPKTYCEFVPNPYWQGDPNDREAGDWLYAYHQYDSSNNCEEVVSYGGSCKP
jgi:hypothetical protein